MVVGAVLLMRMRMRMRRGKISPTKGEKDPIRGGEGMVEELTEGETAKG